MLVVIIAIFGVGLLLDAMFERYSSKPMDSVAQVSSFGRGLAIMLDSAPHPEGLIDHWPVASDYRVSFIDRQELPLPEPLRPAFEDGEPLVLESERGMTIYYFLSTSQKVISVSSDQWPKEPSDGLAWVFTSVFYIGTLGAVLLWLKPLLHRLRLLAHSTKSFGEGDLKSRVNSQGVSYIKDIETDFNRMADQIQQLIEDNKLLTSAVSHDLRTPLARLRFGIDTLTEKATVQDRRYLDRIHRDLREMESLVDSHLQFARLDNVMDGVEKQHLSLRDLLTECVAQFYDDEVEMQLIEDNLSANDRLDTFGCIEHLATLFNNILQNAVKHARQKVTVRMSLKGGAKEITISDDGPGIPEDQRDWVIKPFERGAAGANQGYGLGLAVAFRIAKHHGATISIDRSESLGGAQLHICFD